MRTIFLMNGMTYVQYHYAESVSLLAVNPPLVSTPTTENEKLLWDLTEASAASITAYQRVIKERDERIENQRLELSRLNQENIALKADALRRPAEYIQEVSVTMNNGAVLRTNGIYMQHSVR